MTTLFVTINTCQMTKFYNPNSHKSVDQKAFLFWTKINPGCLKQYNYWKFILASQNISANLFCCRGFPSKIHLQYVFNNNVSAIHILFSKFKAAEHTPLSPHSDVQGRVSLFCLNYFFAYMRNGSETQTFSHDFRFFLRTNNTFFMFSLLFTIPKRTERNKINFRLLFAIFAFLLKIFNFFAIFVSKFQLFCYIRFYCTVYA
jgi:hypothetical protein